MVMGVARTVEGVMAGINPVDHMECGNNRLDFKVRREKAQNDEHLIEHSVRGFHLQKIIEVDVL
jgi:hypothetical protein